MTRQTPALMIQGVSSDAGKSLLAAALCRILSQDGWRVAPFKSQNMALNSCVTPDGLEMGRAQAVQAAACRRAPDVRMNPVLLKPISDMGSQVIVMGQAVGIMKVREYWQYKPTAFARACEAYDALASEVDIMILEGAGSPAEINLREHDIVNMTMARHAKAHVLLAGDIDRGGVFASLVGTLALMQGWERDLVSGLIVNKFRGDASLLPPALEYVTQHTEKPFFGVIPWIEGLNLPDEDSVSFKAGQARHSIEEADNSALHAGTLDIAVLDLPRISNFTDLDALYVEPDVRVRIVRTAKELGRPDMVLIPGSKNTLADLQSLRERGLFEAVCELRKVQPVVIIGICGGLQMLGQRITDPDACEDGGAAAGFGFLDVVTRLAAIKTVQRVRAVSLPERQRIDGYEIHHGQTKTLSGAATVWIEDANGRPLGWCNAERTVFGSYTHGLFDNDSFRRTFLNMIRSKKGLAPVHGLSPYTLEPALDRLADVVREHLDMTAIYKLLTVSR